MHAVRNEGDAFGRDSGLFHKPFAGFAGGGVDVIAKIGEPSPGAAEGNVREMKCV